MFSFLLNNVLQSCTSVVAPYGSIISHRFLSSSSLVSDIRSYCASQSWCVVIIKTHNLSEIVKLLRVWVRTVYKEGWTAPWSAPAPWRQLDRCLQWWRSGAVVMAGAWGRWASFVHLLRIRGIVGLPSSIWRPNPHRASSCVDLFLSFDFDGASN